MNHCRSIYFHLNIDQSSWANGDDRLPVTLWGAPKNDRSSEFVDYHVIRTIYGKLFSCYENYSHWTIFIYNIYICGLVFFPVVLDMYWWEVALLRSIPPKHTPKHTPEAYPEANPQNEDNFWGVVDGCYLEILGSNISRWVATLASCCL